MPPIAPSKARNLATPLLAALLTLASAGCVSDDAVPAATVTTPGDVPPPTLDETGSALARFDQARTVATTLWANGTYTLQEHFFPLNWAVSRAGVGPPPGLRFVDITEKIPRGVPIRITAELDAAVTDGSVQVWVEAPFEEVWAGEWELLDAGHAKAELRIVHDSDGPVKVGLFYDEADRSPEFPYTLRIDVRSDPERLMDSVGGTLDVPIDNATLIVTPDRGGVGPEILIWDPDHHYMGRFELRTGATEIPLKDKGTHLLLLTQGSGDATLAIKGVRQPPLLGSATQEFETFEATASTSSIEWSFVADREPIQVGFFASSGTVAMDFSGILSSPEGPLIEREFAGGPWVRPVTGFGTWGWTEMGAPNLVAGNYDARITFEQAAGPDPIQYGHFVVYLVP